MNVSSQNRESSQVNAESASASGMNVCASAGAAAAGTDRAQQTSQLAQMRPAASARAGSSVGSVGAVGAYGGLTVDANDHVLATYHQRGRSTVHVHDASGEYLYAIDSEGERLSARAGALAALQIPACTNAAVLAQTVISNFVYVLDVEQKAVRVYRYRSGAQNTQSTQSTQSTQTRLEPPKP